MNTNANFFGQIDNIHSSVQKGEIAGSVAWPLEGTATVAAVETTYKNGNPYLSFRLTHPQKGNRDFLIRVPQANDKDTAKFMGMQRIYATLFAVAEASPGKTPVGQAFQDAQKAVGYEFRYTLSEYESFSEKTGRSFTNQSLETLSAVYDESSASEESA